MSCECTDKPSWWLGTVWWSSCERETDGHTFDGTHPLAHDAEDAVSTYCSKVLEQSGSFADGYPENESSFRARCDGCGQVESFTVDTEFEPTFNASGNRHTQTEGGNQ